MADSPPPRGGPPGRAEGGSDGGPEAGKVVTGAPVSSALGSAGKYAGLGLQFAVSILFFLFIGQWVDRKLGTGGLFVIVGVFVGAGGAFYSIYRRLVGDQAREDAERKARQGGGTATGGSRGASSPPERR